MNLINNKNTLDGFTLVELLVSMGIFIVLASIVLVALNPARQFSRTNNARRQSDVKAYLDALGQYSAENSGRLPITITSSVKSISDTGADLCSILVPTYISSLPVDPLTNQGTAISNCALPYTTNYQVQLNGNNRLVITAPGTELGIPTITATR